jgi:hypothetical protein
MLCPMVISYIILTDGFLDVKESDHQRRISQIKDFYYFSCEKGMTQKCFVRDGKADCECR